MVACDNRPVAVLLTVHHIVFDTRALELFIGPWRRCAYASVRAASLFAAAHQDVPLDALVARLRPPRSMACPTLVRYDRDGRLHHVDHPDDRVKVIGYRPEPGEIAGMLRGGGLVLPDDSSPMDVTRKRAAAARGQRRHRLRTVIADCHDPVGTALEAR
ncbi:hypothetical protein AB0D38_15100 [Streptomyces sp. NPDC048279]|jgi:hypothetical protein|uniref:hypothetical protein n=1 Tax=Streptomyces sp. NPDC048279 TaxID=3154714 RepID=UPI0034374469